MTDTASRAGQASSLQSMQLLAQEKITCDNKLIVLCLDTTVPKRRRKRSTKTLTKDQSQVEGLEVGNKAHPYNRTEPAVGNLPCNTSSICINQTNHNHPQKSNYRPLELQSSTGLIIKRTNEEKALLAFKEDGGRKNENEKSFPKDKFFDGHSQLDREREESKDYLNRKLLKMMDFVDNNRENDKIAAI